MAQPSPTRQRSSGARAGLAAALRRVEELAGEVGRLRALTEQAESLRGQAVEELHAARARATGHHEDIGDIGGQAGHRSSQRLDIDQCLTVAGAAPVLGQFVLMQLRPRQHQAEGPSTERALDHLDLVDAHLGFSIWMAGVEVRAAVSSKNLAIEIPRKRLIVGIVGAS